MIGNYTNDQDPMTDPNEENMRLIHSQVNHKILADNFKQEIKAPNTRNRCTTTNSEKPKLI